MAKKRNNVSVKWSPNDYTQFYLFDEPTHSESEIRREYTRLRSVLKKRAEGLDKYGYSERANFLMSSMPPIAAVENMEELKNRLAFGKSLHDTKAYSIGGMKQLQLRYEEETGESIPLGEVLEFDDYMKSWRLSAFSHMVLSSDRARELYNDEYQDFGGSFADFYTAFRNERDKGISLPPELLRRNR